MATPLRQRTLAKPVKCDGIGLHSGNPVHMTIKPAPVNHGIKFKRIDLPDSPLISALFQKVVDTSFATVIASEGAIVQTIEHLMASFSGNFIDNALVEVDAYELPVMDGSAGPYTQLFQETGIEEQDAPRFGFIIRKPIEIEQDGKFVGAYPASVFKISYTIDFTHPAIKKQSYSITVCQQTFAKEIASARTFGFLDQFELARHLGLTKGGSLENAIVLDETKVINEDGLRFKDEFVRHKILDCIGDFSLLGMPFLGHVVVKKSGHAFNHAFIKKFFAQKNSWETCILKNSIAPLLQA